MGCAKQADEGTPSLMDVLPLLGTDQQDGHPPDLCVAVAACVAHRLAVLHERQLRARFGCPLLTADDDGAAEDDGLDDACATSFHINLYTDVFRTL